MDYADYVFYERCAASLTKARVLRDHTNPYDCLSDDQFRERFRLRKHVFIEILHQVEDRGEDPVSRGRASSLTLLQELLVCLQYLSTNKFQMAIGDEFKISQSSVSRIVNRMTQQLCKLSDRAIKFPENLNQVKLDFSDIAGFPAVIGAIDGTHIPILSPGGPSAEIYRNRKGYFSVNVQAVCTAKMLFSDIVARWHGSAHDSRIFDASVIRDRMESSELHGYLIGDSGYPCRPYLLTPVINPTTESERRYNTAHKRTRNKVECAFGIWKRRFPILSTPIRMQLPLVPYIIVATAVLHNFARMQNDTLPFDDISISTEDQMPDSELDESDYSSDRSARNTFIQRFFFFPVKLKSDFKLTGFIASFNDLMK